MWCGNIGQSYILIFQWYLAEGVIVNIILNGHSPVTDNLLLAVGYSPAILAVQWPDGQHREWYRLGYCGISGDFGPYIARDDWPRLLSYILTTYSAYWYNDRITSIGIPATI